VDVSNFSVDKVDEVFEDLVAEADALQPKFDQLKELAEQVCLRCARLRIGNRL